jgi:hypothetical protein
MSKKVEKKKETHKKLDWSSLSSRFTRDKVSKREGKQIPKDFDIAVQKVQDLRTNIERLTRHGRAYVNVLQTYLHSGAPYAQSLQELAEKVGRDSPLGSVILRFHDVELQLESLTQQLMNDLNTQLIVPAEKFVATEIAAAREAYHAWQRARAEYDSAESKLKSVKNAKEIDPVKLLQAQSSYHHARVKENIRFTLAFERHSAVLWMRDFDFLNRVVSYYERQYHTYLGQYQLLYDMEELFTQQSELATQRRQQFREHKENKAKVRKEQEEEAYNNRYQPLVDMLCAEDLVLVTALCVVAASEQNAMLEDIVRILDAFQQTLRVLRVAITSEVQRASGPGSLFRGHSTAIKLVAAFMRLTARSYLVNQFAPLLDDVLRNSDSLNIDPLKVPNNDQRQSNLNAMKKIVQRFVDAIVSSFDAFPLPLRHLAKHLQTECVNRFPDIKYSPVAALIFLRFFCPVILVPESIPGLVAPAHLATIEKKRHPLIIISKVLQNIADGIEFGNKESYMQELNPLIQQNIKPVQEFFDKLVALPSEAPNYEPLCSREDAVNTELPKLHKKIVQNLAEIGNALALYQQDSTIPILATLLAELGEESFADSLGISPRKKKNRMSVCASASALGHSIRDMSLSCHYFTIITRHKSV